MTTINQITHAPVTATESAAASSSATAGRGAIATLESMIAMLQTMNKEIRDLQRNFVISSQDVAGEKISIFMTTKRDAIEQNYQAARQQAVGKMVAGVFSVVGSSMGAAFKSEAISNGAGGIGKMVEAGQGLDAADMTRDAQKLDLLGEYQSNASDKFNKYLENAEDKASEASRQMLDMTRELMSLQERIMSVVKI
jgi:secreted effector protein SseD